MLVIYALTGGMCMYSNELHGIVKQGTGNGAVPGAVPGAVKQLRACVMEP
jgi:hypothetical protein